MVLGEFNCLDRSFTVARHTGAGNKGVRDAFVTRIAMASGATIQTIQFGTTGDDVVYDFVWFNHREFAAVGATTGVFPGQQDRPGSDGFIATVHEDPVSGFLFAAGQYQFGTDGDDEATTAYAGSDLSGSAESMPTLYVGGRTTGSFTGFSNGGGWDAFAVRFQVLIDPSFQTWLEQYGTAASVDSAPRMAASPDDIFLATGSYLLKASRVSGRAAWSVSNAELRTVVGTDADKHVYTLGSGAPGTSVGAVEKRRAF